MRAFPSGDYEATKAKQGSVDENPTEALSSSSDKLRRRAVLPYDSRSFAKISGRKRLFSQTAEKKAPELHYLRAKNREEEMVQSVD
jgi:hypothetical protein